MINSTPLDAVCSITVNKFLLLFVASSLLRRWSASGQHLLLAYSLKTHFITSFLPPLPFWHHFVVQLAALSLSFESWLSLGCNRHASVSIQDLEKSCPAQWHHLCLLRVKSCQDEASLKVFLPIAFEDQFHFILIFFRSLIRLKLA